MVGVDHHSDLLSAVSKVVPEPSEGHILREGLVSGSRGVVAGEGLPGGGVGALLTGPIGLRWPPQDHVRPLGCGPHRLESIGVLGGFPDHERQAAHLDAKGSERLDVVQDPPGLNRRRT